MASSDESQEEEEDCGFGSRKEEYPIRTDILGRGAPRDGDGDGRVRPPKMQQLLAEMAATEHSIAAAKAEVEALAREEAIARQLEEEEAGGPRGSRGPPPPPPRSKGGNARANAIDPLMKKKMMKKNERTIQMPVWTPSGSRGKAPHGHRHYANHCTFRSEEEFDIFRSPPGKKK